MPAMQRRAELLRPSAPRGRPRLALVVEQGEVDVDPAPASIRDRLVDEGEQVSLLGRHSRVITLTGTRRYRLQSLSIAQGESNGLRRIGVHRLELISIVRAVFTISRRSCWSTRRPGCCPYTRRAWAWIGASPCPVGLEEKRLQLEPDHRVVGSSPSPTTVLEDRARGGSIALPPLVMEGRRLRCPSPSRPISSASSALRCRENSRGCAPGKGIISRFQLQGEQGDTTVGAL